MEAGKLRQRITIQEKLTSKDNFGENASVWKDIAAVWAGVEPLAGREFLEAQQTQAGISTRIRIRYRDGIKPAMRVLYREHIYNILSVIHLEERDQELQLMCQEFLNT